MSGTDEANRAKKVEEAYKNASHAKPEVSQPRQIL